MPDEPAPNSMPQSVALSPRALRRRRRERILIAAISALVGGGLASVAFIVLGTDHGGGAALMIPHQLDEAGPRPLLGHTVTRGKAAPAAGEEPPLTSDDRF